MPEPNHVKANAGDALLLIGTMKGAFVMRADASRDEWEVGGPYFPGRAIYALAYDSRNGRNRFWAAVNSPHWGSYLSSSNDLGKSWSEPEAYNIKFPEDTDSALKQIWQITPGNGQEPDTLYCGVEPAALFRSDDAGETWSLVKGLHDHPHRPQWQPGGGGLCLHTILPDPSDAKRMHIAISTGGVYRTDDGGQSWDVRNAGVRAQFLPPGQQYPEFGQCVHKIAGHQDAPGRLYMQNHGGWGEWDGPGGRRPGIGVLRSDDHGKTWRSIAKGLPSDFGFPIVVHPHDADTVYVVPLVPETRTCPGGTPAVWRSENGGGSWQKLARGLPKKESYFTVLRDALDVDELSSPALYFGTTTGQLWIGRDGGEKWECLFDSLPPIHCVKVAVV